MSTLTSTEPCAPVRAEIVDHSSGYLDETLLNDFPEVFIDVATQVTASQTRPEDFGNVGIAAERALISLGCGECVLSAVCPTADSLRQTHAFGKEAAMLLEEALMLKSQPRWLASARVAQRGTTSLPDLQLELLSQNSLNLTPFLADTLNKPLGFVEAGDLPELEQIKKLPKTSLLEKHAVKTANGQRYEVVDASLMIGYTDKPLSSEEYGILTSKLLNLMSENNVKGTPQITQPDGTMQKPIRSYQSMFELRMSGKNRMYFTMHKPTETGEPIRLIILGSHGGDVRTQDNFLDHLQ